MNVDPDPWDLMLAVAYTAAAAMILAGAIALL